MDSIEHINIEIEDLIVLEGPSSSSVGKIIIEPHIQKFGTMYKKMKLF